jgi:hypothetical protein
MPKEYNHFSGENKKTLEARVYVSGVLIDYLRR